MLFGLCDIGFCQAVCVVTERRVKVTGLCSTEKQHMKENQYGKRVEVWNKARLKVGAMKQEGEAGEERKWV